MVISLVRIVDSSSGWPSEMRISVTPRAFSILPDAHATWSSFVALDHNLTFDEAANHGNVRQQVLGHHRHRVLRRPLRKAQGEYDLVGTVSIDGKLLACLEVGKHLVDRLVSHLLCRLAALAQSEKQRRRRRIQLQGNHGSGSAVPHLLIQLGLQSLLPQASDGATGLAAGDVFREPRHGAEPRHMHLTPLDDSQVSYLVARLEVKFYLPASAWIETRSYKSQF